MNATPQNSIDDFLEDIITSYEDCIQKIETIFNTSQTVADSYHVLLNDFQYSLQELRKERTALSTMLRDNMAKNGSLRKNDYDILMNDIFLLLDRKEKEAKDEFHKYIEDQRTMANFLRQGIFGIKNTKPIDNKEKIDDFKLGLETILSSQQDRKNGFIEKFLEYQNIHQKITRDFQVLLDQDIHIKFKDIKKVKKILFEKLV
jgi:hypothetical protein